MVIGRIMGTCISWDGWEHKGCSKSTPGLEPVLLIVY